MPASLSAAICCGSTLAVIAMIGTEAWGWPESRMSRVAVSPDTLFVTISQSGETADTLAALRMAKQSGYLSSLAICNVATSSLVRESQLSFLTQAGPEIGDSRFPRFETYREHIDGKYWFPTYTYADDVLAFPNGDIRMRMVVKYADYRQFTGTITIEEDGPMMEPEEQAPPR